MLSVSCQLGEPPSRCPEKLVWVPREGWWLRWEPGTFLLLPPRYKSLCPETWPTWAGRPQDGVAVLVRHLGYKPEEYKMGR